ncbi:MAG: hypothetical protein HKN42_19620 [Granulosicoccus sp.]|nr:hypothetical protein [Granulosicoccus sp.]
MRYTARQLHCLTAMGIVPWVSAPAPAPADGHVVKPGATDDGVALPPVAPAQSAALGAWLMARPLRLSCLQGAARCVTGPDEAPLLVVLDAAADESADESADLGLSGEAERLFELMLRAIRLGSRDIRLCQLSSSQTTAGADTAMPDSSTATVKNVCNAHTRALLLLLNTWDFSADDCAVEQHQGRLPGPELPLWRIAHPQRLLEQPALKRQSWQVLKSIHALLAGDSPP